MEEADDYLGFIRELARGQDLDGAARGVAVQASTHGLQGLTDKQHAALTLGMKQWLKERFDGYEAPFISNGDRLPQPTCAECPNPVPWCEVYIAGGLHDGVCTWCMQVNHKNDD